MPRVTDEYRANRRAEILAAATRRFAHQGFHATSMADIISESGLSAGAVYRYFPSKEDLISAVAETTLSTADEVFARLLAGGATPSPEHVVTMMIDAIIGRVTNDPATGIDLTRVIMQVWAEALRNHELRIRVNDAYYRLRGHFAEVARRWQAAGNLPAGADPDSVGAAMLSLVQGFALQRLLVSDTTIDGYIGGVRALLAGDDQARTP
ncbi:TetR/AcrR family transcriptional regulator [Rugosimonospora africana]|uniref:TetR family transcriptional regulator n=1 Tax=Rugosimonospora africana TaxID=556532 RepID=A0A8J3R0W9_9ACTN|nr:TetR/AcrR family transcriptional regulator [Rugosimonospora africana]GIH19777.1 TetR family transcriptional regulator [Rugosimonospora africana]